MPLKRHSAQILNTASLLLTSLSVSARDAAVDAGDAAEPTGTVWLPLIMALAASALILVLLIRNQLLANRLRQRLSLLHEQEQQLRLLTDNMTDVVWRVDADNRIAYISPSVEKMLGYRPSDLLGQPLAYTLEPASYNSARDLWAKLVADAKAGEYRGHADTIKEVLQRRKDGSTLWTEVVMRVFFTPEGEFAGAQGASRDIHARRQAEEAIRDLAFNDPLTRLPNRRLLGDRLNQALANCTRHKEMCAIFFLDLDNFKHINDTHGHGGGDSLLQQVAERLRQQLRESDTIGRYGGDEFVIISPFLGAEPIQARQSAYYIGEKILELFKEPFVIGEDSYTICTSIGAVLCAGDHIGAKDLLRQADTAMYQAKAQGHNQIVIAPFGHNPN